MLKGFSVNLRYKSENWVEQNQKIWKSKMAARLWRHLFAYCWNGNQLDTTWFRLIESTNEACNMYQVSIQSDELCRK